MDERFSAKPAVSPMLRSPRLVRRHLLAIGLGALGLARGRAEASSGLRRCRKCRGLVRIGEQSGACPKGGVHAAKGSRSYRLWTRPLPPDFGNYEGRWFECGRCRAIFYGNSGEGICPAGGAHVITGGPEYVIKINQPPAASEEAGWR